MMNRVGSRWFAAVSAIALLTVGVITDLASSVPLKDGDKINGLVGRTSPGFQFRNTARPGAPTQTARGQEHTFAAQRGDVIEVSIMPEDGSALRPALVLFDPTGRQVAYSENPNFFKYQVVRPGAYRLVVLARNNSLGRYSLEIDGLSSSTTAIAPADQIMQNTLKLRVIGCGVPNVARIKIGTEERCTRDIEPGVYTYEEASKSIKLVDTRRDLLASRLQLNVLDRCPSPATSVAQITLTDPQDGKDYTYCATPSRYVQAGAYRYNPTTDTLTPAVVTQNPTTPVTPTTPTAPLDARRQLLQTEYGLTVLENCPAARTSFVVVNFPEGNQIYQYCANPNRLVRAGEYNYNKQTGTLDVATKPVNCTVTIGGICLVK
ncbi:hypothetical protein OsccyDRAFT_3195 [Leptolyngbyaceae cyanobacterium JSC-12]|nr:hypothetical protein OsccyDRAFT_3195 [Leptolyngbyaceae cyanobacterium JSC-12]